jgi:TolB-like protein/DNA-binding winged helix-turn-helix (wHTH) protein
MEFAMDKTDHVGPARFEHARLRFDRYILDLARGSLLMEEDEITLRPKTFAVLRFLVENAGRLVSKEELFAAVWPHLAVTDDTLVQSIAELRRVFGVEGSRLIRTVPRRGYRFDALVVPAELASKVNVSAPPDRGLSGVSNDNEVLRGRGTRLSFILTAAVLLLTAAALGLFNHRLPQERTNENKPAIAVLPFRTQAGEAVHIYLADGLTQEVIASLGRFSALTVMSWNSVIPYKDKSASSADIGRNLAVQYQVEGNVRFSDQRLRANIQLVDSAGRVLWSAAFEEGFTGLVSLQDRIAGQIAGALAIRVTQAEQRRTLKKPTENLEAYELTLRAKSALHRPERAALADARALLSRAIERDPEYAGAYAALAETYYTAVSMGWAETPPAFLLRAGEFAEKALVLDDSDVRARVVLGRIHLFHQQYEQARAELDRALAINPSDARGLAARGNLLMWLGDTDAAIEMLERSERIDPELSAFDRNAIGMAYYLKGRYETAIRQAELNIQKTGVAHFSLALMAAAYAQLSRFDDVNRMVGAIRRTDPTFDAERFGTKFLNPANLQHLREGLRLAGLYSGREATER